MSPLGAPGPRLRRQPHPRVAARQLQQAAAVCAAATTGDPKQGSGGGAAAGGQQQHQQRGQHREPREKHCQRAQNLQMEAEEVFS